MQLLDVETERLLANRAWQLQGQSPAAGYLADATFRKMGLV